MKIVPYVYFEESGEKEKLMKILDKSTSKSVAVGEICKEFKIEFKEAMEVYNIMKNKNK